MTSKMRIVLALVVMLSLVGVAQAGYFWGNASGDWAAEGTWANHDIYRHVPSPIFVAEDPAWQDIAITIGGVTINVTTDGQGAVDLYGGYDTGYNTINVAAGKYWQITHVGQVGLGNDTTSNATGVVNAYGTAYFKLLKVGCNKYTKGIVNVYEGGTVDVNEWGLEVGYVNVGTVGTGTINIEGGTMNVAGDILIRPKGRININKGTFDFGAHSITMSPGARIDIKEGKLVFQDDEGGSQMWYLEPYLTDGSITGYEGGSPLTIDVNATTYVTTITAPAPPAATNPIPADKQRKVLLNATLSWTGGTASHDVYFGTDATAVANATPASPEYKGRQTATSYNPGGLAGGQAYYWRIDEIGDPIVWKGAVWSFATPRTTPITFTRGLTLDRQFHTMPVEAWNTIDSCDVALIKRMGFNFAKVTINPQLMISGSTINTANMAYVEEVVNRFLDQNVPVVVCIHPEEAFKTYYLGTDWVKFTALCNFYHDFAAYMAARWNKNEVAFQLMTEPFANDWPWNDMWIHMYDQARAGMPEHTLILGGADSGRIAGLITVNPGLRPDTNVIWGFTYWDENYVLPFVFQGSGVGATSNRFLKNVPYPVTPGLNPADYVVSTAGSEYTAAYNSVAQYFSENWNMAKQQSVLQPIVNWNNANGGNLKIMCYEMGVPIDPCQTSTGGVVPADRLQYIHDKRLAIEEKNFGWICWSYNETFTVLNYPLRVAFEKGVTKAQISAPTLDALGMPSGCGVIAEPPVADINGDCYVNFKDFAVLAGSWLNCNEPTDAGCL